MVKQYKKKKKFEYRLQKLNNKKGEERNINRTELQQMPIFSTNKSYNSASHFMAPQNERLKFL